MTTNNTQRDITSTASTPLPGIRPFLALAAHYLGLDEASPERSPARNNEDT